MTGKMAGETGYATVISYLVGVIPTLQVGAVYAALATRFPRANSLSHWLRAAWGNSLPSSFLSFLGGSSSAGLYMFAGAGTTLGAALTLCKWVGMAAEDGSPAVLVTCVVLLFVCFVLNLCGLEETSRVLAICAAVELGGLFVVIVAVALMPSARSDLWTIDWTALPQVDAPTLADFSSWVSAVITGGVFVVFSFGGFETIASQAEEAEDPQRDLPRAFGCSLVIVALLNMLIMVATLCVITPEKLKASPDPLTDVMQQAVPWLPREVFTLVLFASAFNSVLGIQIHISRTLWGMARDGMLPTPLTWTRSFARAKAANMPKPQPYVALIVTTAIQVALLLFSLLDLGKNCATLLVVSFMLAHIAYIGVLRNEAAANRVPTGTSEHVFTVGMWVPLAGLATTAFIMFFAMRMWGVRFLTGWLLVSAAIWAGGHLRPHLPHED
eukprot:CAMPEP_0172741204 /NCGR_PEP_ID=MMETSP1074-20121228/126632_1 /TAXON_ID=2916 /ORGANISM="Ceratium fusus, Strain PA161109" /LENGTH=440 /DNA_ID=CAMNT_0013571467 /DNA_START=41 /DNA_END=1363 /DNA_ORIENTATION=+